MTTTNAPRRRNLTQNRGSAAPSLLGLFFWYIKNVAAYLLGDCLMALSSISIGGRVGLGGFYRDRQAKYTPGREVAAEYGRAQKNQVL